MAKPEIEVSNRERAALAAMALGLVDNWTECYIIGADKTRSTLDGRKAASVYASRWKHSERITGAFREIQNLIADQRAAARAEGHKKAVEELTRQADEEQRNSGVSTDGEQKKPVTLIDYSDPNNRKRLYNEVIRDAKTDPKTRLDAAKVFEQIQRDDKQAAREQKQVKAFLPLCCYDCPLYQKAQEKR